MLILYSKASVVRGWGRLGYNSHTHLVSVKIKWPTHSFLI